MPQDLSYTDEVKRFSKVVENLSEELGKFREEIRGDIQQLSQKIESVQRDADIITEGDNRHGVKSIRDVADDALIEAKRANLRIDKILWMVSGAATVAGVVSSIAFNIIQKFL